MCCNMLQVIINGEIDVIHLDKIGVYQKSNEINNRSAWRQIESSFTTEDTNNIIAYDNTNNNWIVVSTSSAIVSVQESSCPTSENQFFYANFADNSIVPAPTDSVFILCV